MTDREANAELTYISHQQGQARCPQCRAVCDERDLRPNTALRDLVDKLLQARPAYIAAIRSHKPGHSRLVKASQDKQGLHSAGPPSLDSGSNKRQLRSGKVFHDTPPIAEAAGVTTTIDVTEDSKVQESPRKRQRTAGNDGIASSSSGPSATARVSSAPVTADVAACPICNRYFKAGRVLEAHVNRCIDNPPLISEEVPAPQQQQQQQPQRLPKKPQKGVPQVKVPAKIAFHLFNDKKLRDKLKDHNLPIHGKRKDLEERYNRLRLEVQLAADKAEAASEAELVRRAMAKEKTLLPVKGFFGAAAKGGLRGPGSGVDAASDDPDLPDVDYDSFAALIQATKERDAARKAKQQKAQLADAPAPASDATKSITPTEKPDQLSDAHQDGNVGGLLGNGQNGRHPAANGSPANRHTSDGQTPIGNEERLTEYPAGALSETEPSDAVLPTRGKPPNSSMVMQRGASQEPLLQHEESFATFTGRPSLHVKASKAQDLQSHNVKCEHLRRRHSGPHDAAMLTSDDFEGLSQGRLQVDLVDEAGAMSDPAAQDQRALQQLQLLNKSAVPAVTNGTSLAKAVVSSHGKGHVLPNSVVHHNSIDQTRNEEALGVLDDIIEDTDSDIEGMAA
ncbi:TPA: hypothetical protein ACH3X1_010019 [Trebouxia sp. C0004]